MTKSGPTTITGGCSAAKSSTKLLEIRFFSLYCGCKLVFLPSAESPNIRSIRCIRCTSVSRSGVCTTLSVKVVRLVTLIANRLRSLQKTKRGKEDREREREKNSKGERRREGERTIGHVCYETVYGPEENEKKSSGHERLRVISNNRPYGVLVLSVRWRVRV